MHHTFQQRGWPKAGDELERNKKIDQYITLATSMVSCRGVGLASGELIAL
jgi:hypothetical protein